MSEQQNGHGQRPMGPPPPKKPVPAKGKAGQYVLIASDGGFFSEPLDKLRDAQIHAVSAGKVRGEQRPDLADVPIWITQIVEVHVPSPDDKALSAPVEPTPE